MQFSKLNIALLFAAALGIANAAPTSDDVGLIQTANATATTVEEPRSTIIIIGQGGWGWDHLNYAGERWALLAMGGPDDCRVSMSSAQAIDKFSSLEVWDGYECKFYRNRFCWKNLPFGRGGELIRPGPWKSNFPSAWRDNIRSYKCYIKN